MWYLIVSIPDLCTLTYFEGTLIFSFQCQFHFTSYNEVLKDLIDFSLTVKVATLIFISGRGSAISSAKQGESGSIYNLVKN